MTETKRRERKMNALDIYLVEDFAHKPNLSESEVLELKEVIKIDAETDFDGLCDEIYEDELMLDFAKAIINMGHAEINEIVQKLKEKAEINLIERANELLECVDPEDYAEECKQERALSDYQNRGCSDFEV